MILDVRELAEIQQGNIPSSLPLPLSMLEDSLKLDPLAWEEKLGFKKPGRDQPIVVYCRSGKRSQSAMDKMTTEGDVEHRFTKSVHPSPDLAARSLLHTSGFADRVSVLCPAASETTAGRGLTGRRSTSRQRTRTTSERPIH